MIDFLSGRPLAEAVEMLGTKSPLGVLLSSAEWQRLPAELRQRAFFSAWVESERFLTEAQQRILRAVAMERDAIADGGRGMNRTRFIDEIQQLLRDLGYQGDPDKEGGLQDLSSEKRLGLIWQMNLDQAHGHAAWKAGMDQDILDAFPAQELVRDYAREDHRPWPQIWFDHNGVFYGEPGSNPDYPSSAGRMIALKTDPIWTQISRFGTPWPPFDWGSGMGLRDIRRKEAEKLGLLDPEDPMIPQSTPFTAGLKASVKGLPASSISRIVDRFGDRVKIDGDTIAWVDGKEAP